MILTYHQIEPSFSRRIYGVTAQSFAEHLNVIARLSVSSEPPSVTFDDGHSSNYDQALPLLSQRGQRATFFVAAAFVGKNSDTMTAAQLRELVSVGHEVGSHSWSHPVLTSCDDRRLFDELQRSRKALQDMLGVDVRSISMPHGSWNNRVIAACKLSGYSNVYTSDFRHGERTIDSVVVRGRLTVRRTMTAAVIDRFLSAKGASLWILAAPYAVKDSIKALLGEKLYYQLWRHTLGRRDGMEGNPLTTSSEISGKLQSPGDSR